MKIYLKILHFSAEHAHGCFCLGEHGETLIPFSMPISAYEQARENGLLHEITNRFRIVQETIIESNPFTDDNETRRQDIPAVIL